MLFAVLDPSNPSNQVRYVTCIVPDAQSMNDVDVVVFDFKQEYKVNRNCTTFVLGRCIVHFFLKVTFDRFVLNPQSCTNVCLGKLLSLMR